MVKKQRAILFGPLPPPYGGVSVFMSTIYEAAMERGIRVWSYRGEFQNSVRGKARRVNHRRFGHIRALLREGRKSRITDSTHFHLEYPHILLLPLWLSAKFILRFKWIKILHDGSLPSRFEGFSGLRKWLFKTAIRNVDEFIVVSRDFESWLWREAGFKGKVSFIPPLLPLVADRGNERIDGGMLEKLERFSARKKRVCTIGFSIPSYGFHNIAEAIERMREETNEDIGMLIVDGGFVGDSIYRESLLNGRDWIEVAENVPHPNLKEVFRRSDVFVRAFEHESFGISRIEALWCGTPVIATNVGETRGMLLYDFGDVGQLRGHLKSVFDGNFAIDISKWAAVFHNEAQENLKNYLSVITGDNGQINAD